MPILYGKVNPLTNYNATLYTLFERLLLEDEIADKPAIITVNGTITYSELNKQINIFCVWLQENLKSSIANISRKEEDVHDITDELAANISCCFQEEQKLKTKKEVRSNKTTKEKKDDVIIGICMTRRPEFIALIFAIWKLHLSFVPLDSALSMKRTISSIQQVSPHLIVCDNHTFKGLNEIVHQSNIAEENSDHLELFQNLSISSEINKNSHAIPETTILNLDDCNIESHNQSLKSTAGIQTESNTKERSNKRSECSCHNNLACIMFTSGSSEMPKGVKISTTNLINRITWQWNEYPYTKNDISLWSKSLIYLESLTEVICPLLKGISVVVPNEPTLTPELILKYVATFNITRLVIVPSFIKLLLDYLISSKESIEILKSITLWITNGEVLPNWLLNKFYDIFPNGKIANFYGCTEVTGNVVSCILSSDLLNDSKPVSLGIPIQNTAIIIFKDEGNAKLILENGNVGEIGVIGLNVSEGYVAQNNNKTESDHKFLPINSFYFKERDVVRNFHKYLSDIRYFTGERYGIMEQTISTTTKTTHQSYIRCSRNESPDKYRKYSLVSGKSCDTNALSSLDIKEHRKKTRALSICATSALPSSSYIVADEIELLNKFKGIKSFSDVGNMPIDKSYRRGSMPYAGSPPILDSSEVRNLQIKSKFKPNIKTTAELVTTEVNKFSISSTEQSSSNIPGSNSESLQKMSSSSVQHLSNIPDTSASSLSEKQMPSLPTPKVVMSSASSSIETFHPITTSVSHTFHILKQISTLTKEKLAVHLTGDLGSIEGGVLYYHGRKDLQMKFEEFRLDPTDCDSLIENSSAI